MALRIMRVRWAQRIQSQYRRVFCTSGTKTSTSGDNESAHQCTGGNNAKGKRSAKELVNRGKPLSSREFKSLYGFEFEQFQIESVEALLAGQSVVVSAPTGSGKTLVGEAAAMSALARGMRIIYTTPLKALSNQKFREFRSLFGSENVGLRTGDTAINGSASLVVMTTEILRNMLYACAGSNDPPPGLEDVTAAVLDEVHYLGDPNRGTVWEECIIYAMPQMQLMCLSATIGNPHDLKNWIKGVQGPCTLIESSFRPVPLTFYVSQPEVGNEGGLVPLLDNKGKRLSKPLKSQQKALKSSQKNYINGDDADPERLAAATSAVSMHETLTQLREQDLLPALWFIFSRKRCDKAVEKMASAVLTTPEERNEIDVSLNQLIESDPDSVKPDWREPLRRGIAAHHAGCLPSWKSLVEELFQRGKVKLVFATETLAAGVNMPARSAVLNSIVKRRDTGISCLTVNELMQMSGRAGRRGFDSAGHVVLAQTNSEGPNDMASVVLGQPEPLRSQYKVTYSMILNMLKYKNLDTAKEILNQSFGNYISEEARENIREAKALEARADGDVREAWIIAGYDGESVDKLEALKRKEEQEKRALDTLAKQLPELEKMTSDERKSFSAQADRVKKSRRQVRDYARQTGMKRLPPSVRRAARRADKLRNQAQKLRESARGNSEDMWDSFKRGMNVLSDMEALEGNSHRLLALGEVAAEAKSENELLLAMCLMSRELASLSPSELAATISAIVASESINRLELNDPPEISPGTESALEKLDPKIQDLEDAQSFHCFGYPPEIDSRLAGLVEAWAWGCTWSEVTALAPTVDDGDLVRLFRRTIDVLKQLPKLPHIPSATKRASDRALNLINKQPVIERLDEPTEISDTDGDATSSGSTRNETAAAAA